MSIGGRVEGVAGESKKVKAGSLASQEVLGGQRGEPEGALLNSTPRWPGQHKLRQPTQADPVNTG